MLSDSRRDEFSGDEGWQGKHDLIMDSTIESIPGNHTFCRRSNFVLTIPWCPRCASWHTLCWRLTGMMIWWSLRTLLYVYWCMATTYCNCLMYVCSLEFEVLYTDFHWPDRIVSISFCSSFEFIKCENFWNTVMHHKINVFFSHLFFLCWLLGWVNWMSGYDVSWIVCTWSVHHLKIIPLRFQYQPFNT